MNDPNLQALLGQLVATLHPEQVYLFGSRARGDAKPDSDYDLMIVLPDDTPPESLSRKNLFHKFKTADVYADVFPMRQRRFNTLKNYIGTLSHTAAKWGARVYG